GRASELSMPAVLPKLIDMEKMYGSISAGIVRRRWRGGEMPGSRLFSWREGIGTLPKALARYLGPVVHTSVTVQSLKPLAGGYRINAGAAGAFSAPVVIIATQPHVAAQLLDKTEAVAAEAAGGIDAPPLAVVFLGYRRNKVEHPLDGLGFLTPEGEDRGLTGAQFCSTMFPGRSPQGHVAVAAYIGGARAPQLAQLPAADLIELAHSEFRDLLGTLSDPVVARVRHWPRGLPQYRLGHEALRAKLESTQQRQPGLFITGNYLSGPSVAVCLDQAVRTASKAGQFLAVSRGSARQSHDATASNF
ncbi:MAG: protoporphyrinogen oxidase, partial [Methyloligellaceae bacterium]